MKKAWVINGGKTEVCDVYLLEESPKGIFYLSKDKKALENHEWNKIWLAYNIYATESEALEALGKFFSDRIEKADLELRHSKMKYGMIQERLAKLANGTEEFCDIVD